MATWVDFKKLRAKLKFADVLAHYNIDVKRRGKQHTGLCPLPGHGLGDKARAFSAELDRGLFHCFGCGAKGNILDFVVLMEGRDPENGADVRRVALELQRKFCDGEADGKAGPPIKAEEAGPKNGELPLEREVAVNAPLDFELQGLDRSHAFFRARNLSREVVDFFGLGFCSRGHYTGRIAIPIHDVDGKLVGYAGRVVDDETVSAENPQYRFPETRERAGRLLEFRGSMLLYNAHRFMKGCNDLIVVQRFPSVWWLTQHGFGYAVATMGTDCSEVQGELIVNALTPGGRVWIMPDGDAAGEGLAQTVFCRVSPYRFVRWLRLPDGKQPTDLSKDEIKECFTS